MDVMLPLPGMARLEQVARAMSEAAQKPPEPAPWMIYTPVEMDGLALPNRVALAAMETGFASARGLPTGRLIAWYAARALGGAGLIVVERTWVQAPRPAPATRNPRQVARRLEAPRFARHLCLGTDAAVPRFAALAAAIHRGGARAAIQLDCPAPDGFPALSGHSLDEIAAAFARAAQRAQAAGFDAVQVLCAYDGLLFRLLTRSRAAQLSPAATHRAQPDPAIDGHGTEAAQLSPAATHRSERQHGAADQLAVRVVRAIRRETGNALPVLVKLSATGDDLGVAEAQAPEVARALAAAGASALEVVAGDNPAAPALRLSAGVGEATQAGLAARIKAAAGAPVLAEGRLLSTEGAEEVLRAGQADAVGIGRALLADPAWLAKARAGVDLEVVPCISCLACFTPGPDGGTGCPVNAEAGREFLPPLETAGRPRRIAIFGATLPGFEFARVAASRGHHVEIAGAGLPLGGLLGLRAGVPGNAEFGRASIYFGDRLVELGVSIVDEPAAADVVVRCLPGPEVRPRWASARGVLLASELLGRDFHELYGIGRRVAVIGPGALAAEVALFLAGWGRRPTVVVPGPPDDPFPDVHPMHAARLLERLAGYNVTLLTGTVPLTWRFDKDRKCALRVRRLGTVETLGPFQSAVSAAGWSSAGPSDQPGRAGVEGASVPSMSDHAGRAGSTAVDATAPQAPRAATSSPAVKGRGRALNAATPRWPQRAIRITPPAEVADGSTIFLGDTPYPEALRDLAGYAHMVARII